MTGTTADSASDILLRIFGFKSFNLYTSGILS